MALDDNELNRRRQEREERRRIQQQEQRKLVVKLVIAGVVLVLCALGILLIVGSGGKEEPAPTEPEETVLQTRPAATSPTQETSRFSRDPTTVIHIRATGDLNVTDAVVNAGVSLSGYDYTRAFLDVVPVLSEADLTLMNFEGNLCGAPYGTKTTSAPQELVQALRTAGVDILQVANSCTVNNGLLGLTSTLNGIRAAGIEPVGAFASAAEFKASKGYTICEIQGIKVAIVAFTKGVGSRGVPVDGENCVNLLYTDYATTYQSIDKDGINRILRNVAAENPDITIAMVHWGSEFNDNIHDTQKSIVSLMQKRGVDVIIGTHPHMVHEITYDEETGNLVAYSLGDFFGDAKKGGTNYSIVLDLEITMDNDTGKTRVTNYSYIPVYTLKENECDGQRRVVRIEQAMAAYDSNYVDRITKAAYDAMGTALTRIDERICSSMKISCPGCGKSVQVLARAVPGEGTLLGKQASCSNCDRVFPVGTNIADYS